MATTQLSWGRDLAISTLLNLPCTNFSMARRKVTPRKGERAGKKRVLRLRTVRRILAEKERRPPSPIHHPSPVKEAPPRGEEMERWVEAVEQLEWWGSHCHHCPPDSCSRWLWRLDHLSWVGRNLLARSSNLLWETKPPRRNTWRQDRWKSSEGTGLGQLPSVSPKEHRAPDLETPFLMTSPWDCHTSRQIWYALPGACYYKPAGGCRSIYSRPHGRHKPLHHSCKMGYNYAQGNSISLPHLGRASTLLKSSPEICFRISVGCKLCRVLTSTGVGKLEWDTQSGLYGILFM